MPHHHMCNNNCMTQTHCFSSGSNYLTNLLVAKISLRLIRSPFSPLQCSGFCFTESEELWRLNPSYCFERRPLIFHIQNFPFDARTFRLTLRYVSQPDITNSQNLHAMVLWSPSTSYQSHLMGTND